MNELYTCRGQVIAVSPEDWRSVARWQWRISSTGYAVRAIYAGGGRVNRKLKYVRLHHLILPKQDGFDVDHINGDRLDNRRENLRYATRQQNLCNSNAKRGGRSGYRGVFPARARYEAKIVVKGLVVRLGSFSAAEDAAAAYDEAALRYHGEFAVLNFDGRDTQASRAKRAALRTLYSLDVKVIG